MSREVIAEEQRKIREGAHGETFINIPARFGLIAQLKYLMDWKDKKLNLTMVNKGGWLFIEINLATPVVERKKPVID